MIYLQMSVGGNWGFKISGNEAFITEYSKADNVYIYTANGDLLRCIDKNVKSNHSFVVFTELEHNQLLSTISNDLTYNHCFSFMTNMGVPTELASIIIKKLHKHHSDPSIEIRHKYKNLVIYTFTQQDIEDFAKNRELKNEVEKNIVNLIKRGVSTEEVREFLDKVVTNINDEKETKKED